MTECIDDAVLTYVCYGLNATGVSETVRAVSVTFCEKEVVQAKDLLWDRCKDHLTAKPKRMSSAKRSEKMAHLQDIVDTVHDLSSRNKMPRCVTDANGMCRWPTFNMAIVSASDLSEKFRNLEEKFSQLESTVTLKLQQQQSGNAWNNRASSVGVNRHTSPSDENLPVPSAGKNRALPPGGVDRPSAPPSSLNQSKPDMDTAAGGGSGSVALINISGAGVVGIPTPDVNNETSCDGSDGGSANHGQGSSHHAKSNVITGTSSDNAVFGVVSRRKRHVFISNLAPEVQDKDIEVNLVKIKVVGARIRKVSPRDAPAKSYKVTVYQQYYDVVRDPKNWGTAVRIRDWQSV